MKPIRLEIEGFTSFARRTAVDFEGLDLFAITGPTGAGKTSLLDAILYALYGRTPRLGKSDMSSLISHGASGVRVQLDFLASGIHYRLARSAKTRKSTATEVILEQRDGDGGWRQIAGGVAGVKEAIERLLGLDFEGFTRAVILPQGEFDQFLRGEPDKRRGMLKDLLGLGVFEEMMRAANSCARQRQMEAAQKEQLLEKTFADATSENLEAHRKTTQDIERQKAACERERGALDDLYKRALQLAADRKAAAQAEADLSVTRAALAGCRQAAELVAELEQQIQATGFDEQLWIHLNQAVPLAKQKSRCEESLKQRRGAIDRLNERRTAAAVALEQKTQRHQWAADKAAALEREFQEFSRRHGSVKEIRALAGELAAAARTLENMPMLEEQQELIETLERRLAAHQLRRSLVEGQACPVCERTVSRIPAAPSDADAQAQQELKQARDLLDRVKAARVRFDQIQERAHKLAGKPASKDDLLQLADRGEQLEKECKQAGEEEKAATNELSQATTALRLAEQELSRMEAEIAREQNILLELERQLLQFPDWAFASLSELEAALKKQTEARESKQQLESRLAEARNLAAQRIPYEEQEKDLLEKRKRLAETIEKAETDLTEQLPGLPRDHEVAFIEKRRRDLDSEIARLATALAAELAAQRRIEEAIEQAHTLRMEVERLRKEAALYDELGKLLAADEFIDYLERRALQTLAQAASHRLKELSQGRYRLKLGEGGEFFVIDGWNAGAERTVKTLSGGESFLASLALALALSEGLAGFSDAHAQTRLDSLFIDEGISTLDAATLDEAIAALETLTTNDRMVGVISHIAELGERLPARIRVDKSPQGSSVRVETYSHSMVAGGL